MFIWLAIGTVAGALSAFAAPENSYGWRGDIAIGIVGAFAGGVAWPMLGIYLGIGVLNAAVGGLIGISLALPVMRMARPDLILYLHPAPKLPTDLP